MIDSINSVLLGILIPLVMFMLKKIFYINHVVTKLSVDMEWLKKELSELKRLVKLWKSQK